MKFGILYRVGFALGLIGVAASGLTGYYGYVESRKLLTAAAEERLLIATRVLSRQIAFGLENIARDARLLALHPQAARLLVDADAASGERDEQNTARLFEGMLLTHPEYLQLRLIAAAEHGLERVRVDRIDNLPARIEGDALQEKGHYPYVFDALVLPPGAVYLSKASINHETGSHAGQEQPTLQVAAPVYDAAGTRHEALGVVVINVDLHGLFTQLARDLPAGVALYLANGEGEYLIHPDPDQAFAFDRGREARVQDEFPAAAALLDRRAHPLHERVTTIDRPGQSPLIAAFVRESPTEITIAEEYTLGMSLPLPKVLAQSEQLGHTILRIVIGFSLLAILLAVLLARALTQPLNQIVTAVRTYSPGKGAALLPHARRDEIGALARSIADMQHQIGAQVDDLTRKQEELDRLARYDSLTGLPNRHLFFERLEQALAHAKRHAGRFTLLFIDLNKFKDINDQRGHAAGDAALRTLARRLTARVRETDTVARLGGDEFVVLLGEDGDDAAAARLAHDLLGTLVRPIDHEGASLQVGASIGISRYPQDGDEAVALIAAADVAMYRAKTGEREHVRFA